MFMVMLLGWALISWLSHGPSLTPTLILQVFLCVKSSSQGSHPLILWPRPPSA